MFCDIISNFMRKRNTILDFLCRIWWHTESYYWWFAKKLHDKILCLVGWHWWVFTLIEHVMGVPRSGKDLVELHLSRNNKLLLCWDAGVPCRQDGGQHLPKTWQGSQQCSSKWFSRCSSCRNRCSLLVEDMSHMSCLHHVASTWLANWEANPEQGSIGMLNSKKGA